LCSIAACNPGYYDVDGQYCDGCECKDDGWGKSCGAASNLGSVGVGASTSATGVLPFAGDENWFSVTFTGNNSTSFHPNVFFSNNPNGEYVFDMQPNACGGTCNPAVPATCCGSEGNGPCVAKVDWETFYQVGFNCIGSNRPNQCNLIPIGTVYIRVYRATGGPTCDSFTINFSN